MTWHNHPQYLLAKNRFIEDFSAYKLTNLHYSLPKIIFICGGKDEDCPNRSNLEKYFKKHLNRHLIFRAEDAWAVISKGTTKTNALDLEEKLASFSDIVIILVESFGTVAELGAFASSEPLRRKLLPILNKDYVADESFVNTGPVTWVNKDSKYKPCIHANFSSILTSMTEIEERISRTSWEITFSNIVHGDYKFSNKVMLFFLMHVLVALGPISLNETISVTGRIINYGDKSNINSILSLGVALGIFGVMYENGEPYYFCKDFKKLFSATSTKAFLHRIQSSRAQALSSLYKIENYKKAALKVVTDVA
ncbi:retron St85 family effector protein [Geomesophilobacter sediminis]|uniref:Retron St85 family effector protein n=1 Tax=Geomesophilobacter sediminis TaxID=2798584 RepID=A0A8J7JGN2_9BACT|nr:retron St85 family effector protein [Geomesophilobacter sediminis]MBJ6726009.1 retron St85 family effector protein [Geomesophilobacter sediminis]